MCDTKPFGPTAGLWRSRERRSAESPGSAGGSCDVAGKRQAGVRWTRPSQAVGLFLRGRTVRTALPVSVVVGTVLSAVNQGDVLLGGDAGVLTWVRVGVNYLVPFSVASVGFLAACRSSGSDPPDLPDSGAGRDRQG